MSGLAALDHHPLPALAAEVIVGDWPFPLDLPARAPRLKWLHQRPAGGARGSHLPDRLLGLHTFRPYRTWRSRNVGEPFIAGCLFAHSTRLPSRDAMGRPRLIGWKINSMKSNL